MKTKKLLTLIITAVIILCVFPAIAMSASAETTATSGTTGDCTWTYKSEYSALTISGNGAMGNYTKDSLPPWGNLDLTSVYIESGVTSIGDYAFYGLKGGLADATLPNSLTSIGDYAFSDCECLYDITIPDGVTSIGECAFSGCRQLDEITFMGDAPTFGNNCFSFVGYDYYGVSDQFSPVYYPGGNETWTEDVMQSYGGYITWVPYEEEIISGTTGDCTWTLKGTVLTISGNGAMADHNIGEAPLPYGFSITEVIIEQGVTRIGENSFYACYDLVSVTISDSVTSIGSCAFFECFDLKSIDIPDSVTSIESSAFYYCGLSSVTIPDSVTDLGGGAFEYSALGSVVIGKGVTSIRGGTFYNCTGLDSVIISDGVTSIGNGAFSYCMSLSSITIPDSVTSIGNYAFAQCYGLTDDIIPDSVTSIGDYAFYYCGLSSVTIPDSVTSIGSGAFAGNTRLTEILFKGNAPSFGSDCFAGLGSYSEDGFHVLTTTAYYPAGNETWTEDAMQQYGGTITWAPYEETKAVDEWNLVLDDDLKVCFYLSADIEQTATVSVAVGDSTKTGTVSSLEKGEDGRYIVTVQIAAAQMNDSITLQVTDMEPEVYTVRQYCDTVLGDESYSSYHALVKEMLNYGAMAQLYFGHNTESLANEGITGTAAQAIPENANCQTVTGKLSGVRFYGASLVYRDKIAVRYYFAGDVSGCTFTANGNAYTPTVNGNICYIEIADILPQNMDQQITLTATDAEGNTLTVAYGPMDYIVRMCAKGSDSLKNLLKALYNYHLAAKALRA